MLRPILLLAALCALVACGAAAPAAPQSKARMVARNAPLATAEVVGVTDPAASLAGPAPLPPAPAYHAAPAAPLAATAQTLNDTAVLEPTAAGAPTPPPATPTERGVARIVIERIGLDRAPVVVDTDAGGVPFVPKHDVGWFAQSGSPGGGENVVLWGHALRFLDAPEVPAPFGQLSQLAPGDQIALYDSAGREHRYRIAQQVWATPDQVGYILPTGHERLTLVSCIGERVVGEQGVTMSHRLITIAEPETA